jgi:hypothetical protein
LTRELRNTQDSFAARGPLSGAGGEFFAFDAGTLRDFARRHAARYRAAAPFPHLVVDDFFPAEVAARLLAEFPDLRYFEACFDPAEPRRQKKWSSSAKTPLPGHLRHILYHLNSSTFLGFLEELSGMSGLVADPDVDGALRHFEREGCLGLHADTNWHPTLRLHRRVNFILYLNRDWREQYGGALELWNERKTAAVVRISPDFNRAVIFDTGENAVHGFPDPLKCPVGTTRKSLQLYYFTSGPPGSRPAAPHGSRFFWPRVPGKRWRGIAVRLLPPILIDGLRWVRQRLRK